MHKTTFWIVLLVLLLAAGAWYLLSLQPADTHPSVRELADVTPAPQPPRAAFPIEAIEPPPAPAEAEPPPEPLPALADSDPHITEALAGLVGPESLGAHFLLEQVINRIVATIDSLPSRKIAPLVMPLRPVAGTLAVTGAADSLSIGDANAARYAAYARIAGALDTDRLVSIYVRFYPLFQESYAALGYPDAYFNDRLVAVIDHLLDTPDIGGPLRVVKPEAVYLYADPALEALSAGQKIMLRIGRDNAAVIRGKLAEIRAAVARQDIPAAAAGD